MPKQDSSEEFLPLSHIGNKSIKRSHENYRGKSLSPRQAIAERNGLGFSQCDWHKKIIIFRYTLTYHSYFEHFVRLELVVLVVCLYFLQLLVARIM